MAAASVALGYMSKELVRTATAGTAGVAGEAAEVSQAGDLETLLCQMAQKLASQLSMAAATVFELAAAAETVVPLESEKELLTSLGKLPCLLIEPRAAVALQQATEPVPLAAVVPSITFAEAGVAVPLDSEGKPASHGKLSFPFSGLQDPAALCVAAVTAVAGSAAAMPGKCLF